LFEFELVYRFYRKTLNPQKKITPKECQLASWARIHSKPQRERPLHGAEGRQPEEAGAEKTEAPGMAAAAHARAACLAGRQARQAAPGTL
jgi:hypothetical protein